MHTQSPQLSQPCTLLETCKSEFLPSSIHLSTDKCKTQTAANPFSIPGHNKSIHDWSYSELGEYKPRSHPTHPLHPRDDEIRCFVLKSTPSAHLSLGISVLLLPPKISNIQGGYFIKALLCWCTFLSGQNSRALGWTPGRVRGCFWCGWGLGGFWESWGYLGYSQG